MCAFSSWDHVCRWKSVGQFEFLNSWICFCVSFIDIWFDPTVLKVCQVNAPAQIKVGRQLVCGCDSHWPTKMRFRTGSKGASYGRGRGKSLVRRWTVVMTDFNFAHINPKWIDNLSAKLQALQSAYCCSVLEVHTSLTKIQKDASRQFRLILPWGNFYDHLAKTPVRFKQWEESALRLSLTAPPSASHSIVHNVMGKRFWEWVKYCKFTRRQKRCHQSVTRWCHTLTKVEEHAETRRVNKNLWIYVWGKRTNEIISKKRQNELHPVNKK